MVNDREFIDVLAKGLAIEAAPFKPAADKLGLKEQEVIERIRKLIGEGKVRRFVASVRHQPMGYAHNAMVIARTDEKNLDAVGSRATEIEAVSHCYHRAHPDGAPFCVYIMVHGRDEDTVARALEKIEKLPGVKSLEVCPSAGELKKTSVSGVSTELGDNDD